MTSPIDRAFIRAFAKKRRDEATSEKSIEAAHEEREGSLTVPSRRIDAAEALKSD